MVVLIEAEAVLFHLSPRPWATMTVEVCLRRAGTTRAALVDMMSVAIVITNTSMVLCK